MKTTSLISSVFPASKGVMRFISDFRGSWSFGCGHSSGWLELLQGPPGQALAQLHPRSPARLSVPSGALVCSSVLGSSRRALRPRWEAGVHGPGVGRGRGPALRVPRAGRRSQGRLVPPPAAGQRGDAPLRRSRGRGRRGGRPC